MPPTLHRVLLPAFVILLLAGLLIVPPLIGRRIDALRDHRVDLVFPAQQALQESRSLLTEQLAASRGYQISGEPRQLARLRDAFIREAAVDERLIALARQLGEETLTAVQDFQAGVAAWQDGHRALLDGRITREQLVASLPLGQGRFEAALAAAEGAMAALNRYDSQLEDRIQAVERIERVLTVLLSLSALAAAAMMVWLMNRLQRVTEQLEARAEGLRVSEERFRLIAENLAEMIWISDPAYTVQYYLSPAYERIWGRPIEEALRNPRSFLDAVVPEDRERVESELEGYGQGRYAAEYRIMRPDGEIRWVSGRTYPVRNEDGQIFLIAGIAEDITGQKEVEQERERLLERERLAHAETEAALKLRDRVVRTVSHDLKNPLHTIGMAAELLEMPLTQEQHARQIGIIRRTVGRANRMVGDLLDAARIESGRAISVNPEPLDVQPLLAEVVEAFRFQANEKHQQLICEAVDEVPPVLGDRDRLFQALSNLLGNAVKFTPEGGRIQLRSRLDDGAVHFDVSDTGRGIPPEVMAHLFEPFTQARDTASLGTGLGLAITKGIVEAHGGTITVESKQGAGTTFTFTLPATSPNQATQGRGTATTEHTMTERQTPDVTPERTHGGSKGSRDGSKVSLEGDTDRRKKAPPARDETRAYPDPVDDALDDTFPASDPLPWWGG